jgi:periplasmic protein TonB
VTSGFAAEQDDDGRRAFRRMLIASGIGHGLLLLGLLMSASSQRRFVLPRAITVDLVASAPAARSAPRPAPAPAPVPKAAPKQVVLPEKPRLPAAKPRARKEVVLEPKPRDEKSLDELMEELRAAQGEPTPAPPAPAEPAPTARAEPSGVPDSGAAVRVPPEQLAWIRKVKVQVMRAWVVPPSFRRQALQTEVVVSLDALGGVQGTRIVRRSGNPWYDEGVVRSIEKASPLPTPPESGDWTFIFASDETY